MLYFIVVGGLLTLFFGTLAVRAGLGGGVVFLVIAAVVIWISIAFDVEPATVIFTGIFGFLALLIGVTLALKQYDTPERQRMRQLIESRLLAASSPPEAISEDEWKRRQLDAEMVHYIVTSNKPDD